jgi:hypothetical protein
MYAKRGCVLILVLLFPMLVSLATRVPAESEKTEFMVPGYIWDVDREISGVISLTLSGQLLSRAPDYEEEDVGEYTYGPYEDKYEWNYTYSVGNYTYMEYYYSYYYDYYRDNHSRYVKKWYSPLPTYNGELVVIWEDGSTSTFTVDLSPTEIRRYAEETEYYSEHHYAYNHTLYWWDGEKWVYDYGYGYRYGYVESGAYNGSGVRFKTIGKIQSGDGPLEGVLDFTEYEYWHTENGTSYWDGYTTEYEYTWGQHGFWAYGTFGPYELYGYRYVYVASEVQSQSNPEYPKYVERITNFEELPSRTVKILPIVAAIDVDHGTLNLWGDGDWITPCITLPEGYDVSDIDVDTILLEGDIPAGWAGVQDGVLIAKFNRTALTSHVYHVLGIKYGTVRLTISGSLDDGTPFEGSNMIKVIFAGDVNDDGCIDSTDLGIFGVAWSNNPYNPSCDFNSDGVIDSTDYGLLATNYGAIVP